MQNCIKGGYGIAVPSGDGTYKFYYFDGDLISDTTNINGTGGQKLAYDVAVKIRDKGERKNYISVTVSGKLSGATRKSVVNEAVEYPEFKLETIEETKTETLTGYLIDEHCFEHKSTDPGKDTKDCLLMDNCIKGGYGIAVPQTDGSYKFYYLNGKFFTEITTLNGTAGQKLAYDLIVASTKTDHIVVTVKGAFTTGVNKPSINLQGVTYPTFDAINLAEATNEEVANVEKIISDAADKKKELENQKNRVVANNQLVVENNANVTLESQTKENSNIPKTGDSSSILYIIALFSISVFTITYLTKSIINAK